MRSLRLFASSCVALLCLTVLGANAQTPAQQPNRPSAPGASNGNALIDNDRVVVQKFVVAPGAAHPASDGDGKHLWVQMTDGEWKTNAAAAQGSLSKAGAVDWSAGRGAGPGRINSGSTPVEVLQVTLKPHTADPARIDAMKNYRLIYPEIPGEILLENDDLVVQRFIVQPGAWEGLHAHPGNQLYIHIKGGTWDMREAGKERVVAQSRTGSVGWFRSIPLSAQHQSGNAGTEPIDLIWVTLKR